jgi:GNAT superfamily N-acetyltransferase
VNRSLRKSPARIRSATRADVPLVLGFIKELASFERLAHEVTATEPLLRKALFGPRRVARAIICETDEGPVGFAVFFATFSTFLGRSGIYLEDLYVRPRFRGRGYGRALLSHIARLVQENGGGRLEWSVLDWNVNAIGFYESIGAQPVKDWTRFRLSGAALDRFATTKPARVVASSAGAALAPRARRRARTI